VPCDALEETYVWHIAWRGSTMRSWWGACG
jgi:hypothetical protein